MGVGGGRVEGMWIFLGGEIRTDWKQGRGRGIGVEVGAGTRMGYHAGER